MCRQGRSKGQLLLVTFQAEAALRGIRNSGIGQVTEPLPHGLIAGNMAGPAPIGRVSPRASNWAWWTDSGPGAISSFLHRLLSSRHNAPKLASTQPFTNLPRRSQLTDRGTRVPQAAFPLGTGASGGIPRLAGGNDCTANDHHLSPDGDVLPWGQCPLAVGPKRQAGPSSANPQTQS